jgi:hypothetical protein
VAPLVRTSVIGQSWEPIAADVIGTGGHFGYPFGPWMAYPMIGFVIGRLAATHRELIDKWRILPFVVFAAGVPFGLASLAMIWRGSEPARYGSMNAAYFLASLFVVPATLSLAVFVSRTNWMSWLLRLVSLEGLRSFAVVPIHYVLLEITALSLGAPVDAASFDRNMSIILAFSFLLSRPFVRLARSLDRPGFRGATMVAVAIFAVAYYVALRGSTDGFAATCARSVFQLSLCVVLAFRDTHHATPSRKTNGA